MAHISADVPSSSPAFATQVPIRAATVLPVLLPPATLRPVAFRLFTKKHGLTLTSGALAALATFIGRHCGAGWREAGLAEPILDEAARAWKTAAGPVIVSSELDDLLPRILSSLEECIRAGRLVSPLSGPVGRGDGSDRGSDNRPGPGAGPDRSFHVNRNHDQPNIKEKFIQLNDDLKQHPRTWLKLVDAFIQPRLRYNATTKHFDRAPDPSDRFATPADRSDAFRQRYLITLQRVQRNEAFAPASDHHRPGPDHDPADRADRSITAIANLLGRSGSSRLLFGLLSLAPTGGVVLADPTGSVALDLSEARPVPESGTFFGPGMLVLVDGIYEAAAAGLDGASGAGAGAGANSGLLASTTAVAAAIPGRIVVFSVGQPPCERRIITTGAPGPSPGLDNDSGAGTAAAIAAAARSAAPFGWTDFLGVGSERAAGIRMRRMHTSSIGAQRRIVVAADVVLDAPHTMSALRALLGRCSDTPSDALPLAIVLLGNFCSVPAMAGSDTGPSPDSIASSSGSGVEYKEAFDRLAAVLGDFGPLLARTTLVLIPGDNDPWAAAGSSGAAVPLPRKPIPEMFVSRLRRAVAEANQQELGRNSASPAGELILASNPARLSVFGCAGDVVFLRDDIGARLRRSELRFSPLGHADDGSTPTASAPQASESRRIVHSVLSQSHLSPFPLHSRPVRWLHAASLSLYPLPSALVLADAETEPFAHVFCGSAVLNPGPLVVGANTITEMSGRRTAAWAEIDVGPDGSGMRASLEQVDY